MTPTPSTGQEPEIVRNWIDAASDQEIVECFWIDANGTKPKNETFGLIVRKMRRRLYKVLLDGLQATLARPDNVPDTDEAIRYVLHYGSGCRDCADEAGVCPGTGLPCEVPAAQNAIRHVIRALNYGLSHGLLAPARPDGGAGATFASAEAIARTRELLDLPSLLVSPRVEGPTEHPQAPPGYVVVPVEPTEEMLAAVILDTEGARLTYDYSEAGILDRARQRIWAAMLAARPVLPEQGGD